MATDPGPFEQIYERHAVGIYRFVYARVGNQPDAEDLTAQVFVRAVEQLDVERPPGQIAAWLYRVAHNATADYWRAFYRLPVIGADQVALGWEPAEDAPTSRADDQAQADLDARARARVEALLGQLPAQYRRVLELRFLERRSVAETARAMGISSGNARVLQYRALRRAALVGESGDG